MRIMLLAIAAIGLLPAQAPDSAGLTNVQTVYILPMTSGLDQYLANRLTSEGVFHVATDPKKADAILTDRLGTNLETKLDELYPPATKKEEGAVKGDTGPMPSRFNPAKGNVFLVDVKTRNVIWSVYQPSKNTSAGELNRTAAKIAGSLHKATKNK